jgi:hypothetical protein
MDDWKKVNGLQCAVEQEEGLDAWGDSQPHQILKSDPLQRISFSVKPFYLLFFASPSLFSFHRHWHHSTNNFLFIQ